jgi:hypothetical protein
VCEKGKELSQYAFCVNEGTCKRKVEQGDPHPLCNCPSGYEGRHCQYEVGTAPEEEISYVQKRDGKLDSKVRGSSGGDSDNDGISGGTKFLIVVIALASVAIAGYCLCSRKNKSQIESDTGKESADETEVSVPHGGDQDVVVEDLPDDHPDADNGDKSEKDTTTDTSPRATEINTADDPEREII